MLHIHQVQSHDSVVSNENFHSDSVLSIYVSDYNLQVICNFTFCVNVKID